jgi:hypothetical protein
MLRNIQYVSGPGHGYRQINRPGVTTRAIAAGLRIAKTLQFAIDGWREALAACREYEQLRSQGVPHEIALPHALGAGPAPAQHRCRAAHPLCFAGRA